MIDKLVNSRQKLNSTQRAIGYLLVLGSLGVTVIVSPWSFDPISVPKFTLIALIALLGLILHLTHLKSTTRSSGNMSSFNTLLLLLALLLTLNLFVNDYALSERLFGVGSRNTGYITYLSFIAIAFLTARHGVAIDSLTFLKFLYLGNVVVTVYYIVQRTGFDFIEVTNFYSRPSSSLGNPNFVSGFLGMTAIIPLFVYLRNRKFRYLASTLLGIIINLLVIVDSQSIQGLFTFGFSVALIGFAIVFYRYRNYTLIVGLFFVITGILAFLGIVGKGPLSSLLYTSTIFSRFDYWRAAVAMAFSNPIFGVGLDGYGDFYRIYRDPRAFSRFGESQTTDTPHNLFLDYFASGGLPLGVTFFILVLLVYLRAFKVVLSEANLNYEFFPLFVVLNGYLIQCLVSPNSIGLGVWLWILLGRLWYLVQPQGKSSESKDYVFRLLRDWIVNVTLRVRMGMIVGLLSALPVLLSPLIADIKFLKAANASEGNTLITVATTWPMDTKRLVIVEGAISAGTFEGFKLQVAQVGVRHNPNSFQLWRAIFENPYTSNEGRSKALAAMKRLEPRFEEFSN